MQKFPGVIAAPLIIGTIAGSGGKFLQDGIQLACGTLPGKHQPLLPQLWLVQRHLEAQVPVHSLTRRLSDYAVSSYIT